MPSGADGRAHKKVRTLTQVKSFRDGPIENGGSSALDVELLQALPADAVTTAWRQLVVSAENPFASPDWLVSCLESFGNSRPLIAVCRSRDGELIGVVPLLMGARARLSSPGDAYADWFGPACAAEHEGDVAQATVSALHKARYLASGWTMTRCPVDEDWLAGVRRARHPEYELLATEPEMELSLVRFSGAPAISGKDRREIARLLRRLQDTHEVRFDCARTREEGEAAFAVFERLHLQRWPDLQAPGVARFHRGFALRAADQGWLQLWTLTIDGEPVAALYGWRIGGRSFAYMQAFDAAWSRHGVGILLLEHAVRASEEEGSEIFDMLRGQERHKARFENDRRSVQTFVVVGGGSLARLAVGGRVSARRAYQRLPSHQQNAIRRLLRRA